jgi:hypothetical protein
MRTVSLFLCVLTAYRNPCDQSRFQAGCGLMPHNAILRYKLTFFFTILKKNLYIHEQFINTVKKPRVYIVACLFKARIVKPAETAAARERSVTVT